jgi:probable phosphoglycerate mutase
MRFYFVRHGQSEANVDNRFSNQNFEIHPLTETGVQQARALAEKLREQKFTHIYASPMLRARQTAEILSAAHQLEIEITPALREHDAGDLEGRADQEAWDEYTRLIEAWREMELDARISNGESFNDMRERFLPFVSEVAKKYSETDAQIVFVGHGGIFHTMLPQLMKNLEYEFTGKNFLANTGVVVAEYQEGELVCLEWNGVTLSKNGAHGE